MVSSIEFLKEVRKLVGVPFKNRGRNSKGVDCGGVVIVAAGNLGVSIINPRPYSADNVKTSTVIKCLEDNCARIVRPVTGCLIFNSSHVMVYTDTNTVVHAVRLPPSRVVEHRYIRRKIDTFWALNGVDYGE